MHAVSRRCLVPVVFEERLHRLDDVDAARTARTGVQIRRLDGDRDRLPEFA